MSPSRPLEFKLPGDGYSGVVNSERDLQPAELAAAFVHLNYVPGADPPGRAAPQLAR